MTNEHNTWTRTNNNGKKSPIHGIQEQRSLSRVNTRDEQTSKEWDRRSGRERRECAWIEEEDLLLCNSYFAGGTVRTLKLSSLMRLHLFWFVNSLRIIFLSERRMLRALKCNASVNMKRIVSLIQWNPFSIARSLNHNDIAKWIAMDCRSARYKQTQSH